MLFSLISKASGFNDFEENVRPIQTLERLFEEVCLAFSFCGRFERAFGSFLPFNEHCNGGFGHSLGVNQRSQDHCEANQRQEHRGACCPEQCLRPKGHFFLSYQVALFAFLFLLRITFIFQSFRGAPYALDLALDGVKYECGVVGFGLLLGLSGAGLASGIIICGLSQHVDAQRRAKDCGYASPNGNVPQPTGRRHLNRTPPNKSPPQLIPPHEPDVNVSVRWLRTFINRQGPVIACITSHDCIGRMLVGPSIGGRDTLGAAMAGRELSWIFLLPIKCRCGQETEYAVAVVIEHDILRCKHCGQDVDLTSQEWSIFRQGLGKSISGNSASLHERSGLSPPGRETCFSTGVSACRPIRASRSRDLGHLCQLCQPCPSAVAGVRSPAWPRRFSALVWELLCVPCRGALGRPRPRAASPRVIG